MWGVGGRAGLGPTATSPLAQLLHLLFREHCGRRGAKTGCQRTRKPTETGSPRNNRELTVIASPYDLPKQDLNNKNISRYGNAGEGNLKGPAHK